MSHVHPRRLLALARQEGLLVPRAGAGRRRHLPRGGQLRPVPEDLDGGDRAPDAARQPLAVAARRGLRHGPGPALRQRPFRRRASHRNADVRGVAGVRPAAAQGPVEGRPRDQRTLRPAAAGRHRLAERRPAPGRGNGHAPVPRVHAAGDARAGDDLRRRRRVERVPAAERAARRALARRVRRRSRDAGQEPFLGGRRPRRAGEPAVPGRAQADEAGSMNQYLKPGKFIDSAHPAVRAFAAEHERGAEPRDKAVALYYAVRDRIRYNPFQNFTQDDAYRGSTCLERRMGWCVSKAALLAASARAVEIPARAAFADVKNHPATPELTAHMGTALFVFHGYTELYLDGKWVKATPAFNLSLCTKFRVKPLEFDGHADSIFHPFDQDNRRHMEYVRGAAASADRRLRDAQRALRATKPHITS